jgi:hypothetical protein
VRVRKPRLRSPSPLTRATLRSLARLRAGSLRKRPPDVGTMAPVGRVPPGYTMCHGQLVRKRKSSRPPAISPEMWRLIELQQEAPGCC